ncbi:hypothetical protein B0T18DRAFT_116506 [Schizothecium vesticola]|uniref:Uncharacterized protein n=1 Tax=Schizothecium vesticola TaxID=314040 RepID=A0AA40K8Y4_9PEZI|nr:hypothetical protein B0T18DRAFT_116506 [Schizothecium vesticola]
MRANASVIPSPCLPHQPAEAVQSPRDRGSRYETARSYVVSLESQLLIPGNRGDCHSKHIDLRVSWDPCRVAHGWLRLGQEATRGPWPPGGRPEGRSQRSRLMTGWQSVCDADRDGAIKRGRHGLVMASHGKRRETGAKRRRDKNAKKPPCLLDHRPRLILRFVSERALVERTSHKWISVPVARWSRGGASWLRLFLLFFF